jgi:alpha-L-fucosidase
MKKSSIILVILFLANILSAQLTEEKENVNSNLNKPEREEWFRDLGFGMFIHFSFDSQLGVVISHSMAGASDD